MDLFGPFLVNGRAISTGLQPQAGDKLSVLTTGELTALVPGSPAPDSVTADGLSTAPGAPDPAPAGWLDPGLTKLSLVGHLDGQSVQLGNSLTVLPKPGQALPVGAELKLDVNAPALTDYEGDDGWSVYIVRTGAGEAVPTLRDWVFFEDLTPVTGNVGGIAAAVLGSLIHVFWTTEGTPYGLLNHLTIDSAGVISPTTIVDQYAVGFSAVSAAVHKGGVYAFYCANRKASFPEGGLLGVLRRAVIIPPAGVFELFDIDGDGVSSGGAIKGVVGIESSAVSTGDDLHVLYLATRDRNVPGDPGDGLGASVEDLLHASVHMPGPEVAGAPYIWLSETIDGAGGVEGKVAGDTGTSIAAMIDQAAQVHVFYSLGGITGRTTGGFDLRHAELDYVGGATEKWRRETLDGAGSTFANAKGQKKGRVGLGTAGVRRNGELNVFYNDDDNANLRWGVKPQGFPWAFETIDGRARSLGGRGPRRYGSTKDRIRAGRKAAVKVGDQVSVFYEDRDLNVLRHAYKRPGLPWMMEVVDGDTTLGGRVQSAVGKPAAVVRGGFLNLIYFDAGRQLLRHAVLSQ